MKLRVAYNSYGFPVEVLIEGESLDPSKATEILWSCLEEAHAWLDRITLKNDDAWGGQLGTPTSPRTLTASQTTHPPEAATHELRIS